MTAFDFVDHYRALQPTADRAQIAARTASFEKAATEADASVDRIIDLAYHAYLLPVPAESDHGRWLGEMLRENDPTFSIDHDVEESARIATLVLRRRLEAQFYTTPIVVHAASFAGRRQTVDKHGLSDAARRTLADLVRRRGSSTTRPSIASGKAASVTDLIKKLDEGTEETDAAQVFEAVVADYKAQIKQVVTTANAAVETVSSENRRLAEEIDLLWWHLGGHSLLLDRPISDLPVSLRPIVIGMDVGQMITTPPGPYGTYGIMRKALGDEAGKTFRLGDAIKELSASEFGDLMSKRVSRYAIAPIHGAFADILLDGTPVATTQFKRRTGLSLDTKLTGYELAVQAYHERLLHKLGHI